MPFPSHLNSIQLDPSIYFLPNLPPPHLVIASQHMLLNHQSLHLKPTALPFGAHSLSRIVLDRVLCAATNADSLLDTCRRVLQRDGQLVIIDWLAPQKLKAVRYCSALASYSAPNALHIRADWQWRELFHQFDVEERAEWSQEAYWGGYSLADTAQNQRYQQILLRQAPPLIRAWYGITMNPKNEINWAWRGVTWLLRPR